MGIFGIAKKGFGMLGKARAKKKMLSGTSTRAERLKHGERSPDIKSVPVSPRVKKEGVAPPNPFRVPSSTAFTTLSCIALFVDKFFAGLTDLIVLDLFDKALPNPLRAAPTTLTIKPTY